MRTGNLGNVQSDARDRVVAAFLAGRRAAGGKCVPRDRSCRAKYRYRTDGERLFLWETAVAERIGAAGGRVRICAGEEHREKLTKETVNTLLDAVGAPVKIAQVKREWRLIGLGKRKGVFWPGCITAKAPRP